MAIEYKDGSFEIGDLEDMKEKFFDAIENGVPVSAFHVGSAQELQKKKEEAPLKERMDTLEAKLDSMETPRSGVLHIPTVDDIKRLGL